MRSLLSLSLFVFFVSACGESGSSPPSPTSPSPTSTATLPATDLTIAGLDVVLPGYSVKYDATATLSNGVTIYHAAATWTTDDAGVSTINSNGVLTGQRQGTATVTATYRGATATTTVRVSAKPSSKPFPARANLMISYSPDPVPGSLAPCTGPGTPTWSYSLVITETQGVGFNLKVFTWNLHDEDGRQIYSEGIPEEEYFAPNSVFVEEVCTSLAGRPNGSTEDILGGVDDNGHPLTFASNRLRFLPVVGIPPTSSPISPTVLAPRPTVRARHRVR